MFDGIKFKKISNIDMAILRNNAAYIAGLIDGEGSFVLRVNTRKGLRFSPLISLGMTHKETVQFVADTFKVGPVSIVKRKKPRKDIHVTRVTSEKEIEQICQVLNGYSKTKSTQIQLLLEYFSLKKSQSTSANSNDISKQNEILSKMVNVYIKLKKANHRGQPLDYNTMKEKLLNKIYLELLGGKTT